VKNRYISLPFLRLTPSPTEGFSVKFSVDVNGWPLAKEPNAEQKIAENFNWLSSAHQRYRRQTDRRTGDSIANVNVSSRSLKTTCFGRFWCTKCASYAYVYKVTWLTKLPPVSVHVISISCSAHWGVPVWYFSGRKCRYDLYPSKEVPVWHTVSYRPTSSTACAIAIASCDFYCERLKWYASSFSWLIRIAEIVHTARIVHVVVL